jgi:hypothetical protein
MANNRTNPEAWNRIFSYVDRPTANLGNDGDYYIDELTNLLYGPKANGVWPKNGRPALGTCKRSTLQISDARSQRVWSRKKRFSWREGVLSQWCNKLRRHFVRSRPSERLALMPRANSL